MTALLLVAGVLLDLWWGEPRRWHPLIGFGRCAAWLEKRLNRGGDLRRRLSGLLALLILIVPLVLLCIWLIQWPLIHLLLSPLVLWFSLGFKSLGEHIEPIRQALERGDEPAARRATAMICSRDEATLDIERTAVESVLENGNDAVFGALFWFCVAGAPGALAFRLINTLDACWGYRSERFLAFGWAAARLDDLVGLVPARLTALSYALCGQTGRALRCWKQQAPLHDSPNGGPVMASGGGALGLQLGGPTRYRGVMVNKPTLGEGRPAEPQDLARSMRLLQHSVLLWLAVVCVIQLAIWLAMEARL